MTPFDIPHDAEPPSTLDDALDALGEEGGVAEVSDHRGGAEVDVAEVDRLGVRVRGVRVRHAEPRDPIAETEALPERLRPLGEEVEPVEVDPVLGGGVLRTRADALRDREFFEVGVRPEGTDLRRYRVDDRGDRAPADWTMTRDQLRRLVRGVRGD